MTATVKDLGARTLRKLGVTVVSDAVSPVDTITFTGAQLATRALRDLGIIVAPASQQTDATTYTQAALALRVMRELNIPIPEANRPTPSSVVALADLGARTLRAVGHNPVSSADVGVLNSAIVAAADIAANALRLCGINPNGPSLDFSGGAPTVTQATIATRALIKLGVYDPSETPSAADLAEATIAASEVQNSLYQSGIASWTADTVPVWAEAPYVAMVMAVAGSSFGKPQQIDLYAAGQAQLWALVLSGAAGQARALAAVTTAHDRLAALGYVSWAVSAIPSRAADSYVPIVAAMLVPQFMGEMGSVGGSSSYVNSTQAMASAATSRMQIVGGVQAGAAAALETLKTMAMSGPYGQALAEAKITTVHDAMSAQGVISWALTAVPAAHAETYVAMAATLLAPDLAPRDAPTRQADQATWDAGEGRLRRASQVAGAQALAMARVASVHGELNAMSLVTWGQDAVPDGVADAYVQLATNAARPSFNEKFDPAERDAGMARVSAFTRIASAQSLAESRLSSIHGELIASNYVMWTLATIPEAVSESYVQLTANSLAPSFGGKFDVAVYAANMKRIRHTAMGGATGQALAEQKVRAVHSDLDGRGKVVWSIFDLPDYAEEPYVLMAASLLAPEMDLPPRPDWWADGEMRIHRQVALSTRGRPVVASYF